MSHANSTIAPSEPRQRREPGHNADRRIATRKCARGRETGSMKLYCAPKALSFMFSSHSIRAEWPCKTVSPGWIPTPDTQAGKPSFRPAARDATPHKIHLRQKL